MRIAHILPTSAVFPLKKHNGRYEWALRLARLQSAAGHEVTIFAGDGSSDDSAITWRSINSDEPDKRKRNLTLLRTALKDTHFDVYHSHFDALHYAVAHMTKRPIVVTQHWFPNTTIAHAAHQSQATNVHTIPVTHYMRQADVMLGIPCEAVIYHGIDLKLFHTEQAPNAERLIYVGRVSPQKGILETIKQIVKTSERLDIVGKVNDKDRVYWEKITPYIDGDKIRYLGQKTQPEVADLLANAKAFVFLPHDTEAFGQTIIEAQACGTPVILNDLGANHELVDSGKSGLLIRHPDELSDALQQIPTLDRAACRQFAERFSLTSMYQAYEALYASLVSPDNAASI